MSERDQVNNMLVETVNLSVLSENDGSGQVPVSCVARINGVALNRAAEGLGAEALRQRACTELLRQAAIREGLLAADDAVPVDGVTSEAASQAIDAWLTRELQLPEPSVEACQRHHAAHQARYRTGEKIQVRHILFAVTPGMDVVALRNRAEACLLDVRCHDGQAQASAGFGRSARELSNCPSAELGGDLGWLSLAQLPSSLATAAAGMNSNEVQAVASPGGISILLLIDKRQVAMSDPRDSVLSLKQIAITFPAGTAEAQIAPLVNRFSEETQQIAGCGVADEMAAKLGADVVNRDGIKIRDLPAPLQQVMLDLQIGQSTPPYGSLQDGVRVFVLCGRDAPEVAASESFDEIMSRLEEERVNKRARIYLRDLRRDAVIEYN